MIATFLFYGVHSQNNGLNTAKIIFAVYTMCMCEYIYLPCILYMSIYVVFIWSKMRAAQRKNTLWESKRAKNDC